MREVLLACVERGFEMVQVESDSKNLVDILNGALQNELKLQLRSIEFLFTSRVCNGAAHQVAAFVTRVGGVHVWDCYEP
ncbi:ribonuclease H protein [Pyrus ussuriensis x Pyrus communis]|uniref:Ribonuclease H protein n=1 Tax=Pyrus ussuriensis x Pyrus communis TaxID=2448454 RepID=A0A5N5HZF2_9ROSA|nr:ribonuclease H protein [Pyrus ussuriensis x Pyrus communis]